MGDTADKVAAFEAWVEAHTSQIHADAINEAAMGFAAGWDAARSGGTCCHEHPDNGSDLAVVPKSKDRGAH